MGICLQSPWEDAKKWFQVSQVFFHERCSCHIPGIFNMMTNEFSESESVTRRMIANLEEDKQLTNRYQDEWSIFEPEIAQMQPV